MKAARPHVLLTCDSVGGVWTYALDLAAGLVDFGVDVTLACLGPAPGRVQVEAAEDSGARLLVTGLPLDWLGDARAMAAAETGLARLVAETGADLLHLNSPALLAGIDCPVPVVAGCHSCLATWWQTVHPDAPLPADFRWRVDRLRRGYARADALVAPSHGFARATEAVHGIRPLVVWNGRPSPASGRDAQRRPIALAAGRLWDAGKGLAALDRAAATMQHRVEAAGPTTGPGGEAAAAPHVQLLGNLGQQALHQRMAGATVFVSLARYEPFGLAVLEAAQAGCALVLADTPVFRELWDGAACFVDAGDPEAAAAALDALLEDTERAARLGCRARTRAAVYTADAMAGAMLSLYRRLLARDTAGVAA